MKSIGLVVTTIYDAQVLRDYGEKWKRSEIPDWELQIIVVRDLKTPESISSMWPFLTQECGAKVIDMTIPFQEEFAQEFGGFYDSLPFNNDTRRNIGYLYAYHANVDLLVSIDDDNYPGDDFYDQHLKMVGSKPSVLASNKSGFYNNCEAIEFQPSRKIFPRGFPFKGRDQHVQGVDTSLADKEYIVGVNAGLWLVAPDIDAITWLNGAVEGTAFVGSNITLDNQTWCPINTQNTAVIRDLIPFYYCVAMGDPIPGGRIHRYGDIWGGYFLLALLSGSKYVVNFGHPICDHIRNPHDYLNDLREEYWGMLLTDLLVQKLRDEFLAGEEDLRVKALRLCNYIRSEFSKDLPVWVDPSVKRFLEVTADRFELFMHACYQSR